jgi:hypothetical protein
MPTKRGILESTVGPVYRGLVSVSVTVDAAFIATGNFVAIYAMSFRSGNTGSGTNTLEVRSGGSGGTAVWSLPRLAADNLRYIAFPSPVFSDGIYLDLTLDSGASLGTNDFMVLYYELER